MKNDNNYKSSLILSVCGIFPVVWLALLIAPYIGGGLVEIIENLAVAINNPFSITVCGNSVKTVLIFLLAYYLSFHTQELPQTRGTRLCKMGQHESIE